MYNLRYHIASLVGVFLALALGLVLGGLVVQRGTVDRQQGALVKGLRSEFTTLRAENKALTAENAILNDFSADMSGAWIADRLVGKNVLVFAHAGRTDGLRATTEAIQAAGGTPITVTVADVDFGLKDAAVRSSLASATEFSPDLVASVATSLASEWAEPTRERPVTQQLVSAGVLTTEGFDPGMAAFAMVDVASTNGKTDSGSLALAAAFAKQDRVAVVAETPGSKSDAAVLAADRKLSAFNTLGTATGSYTLIALLTGAEPGFYGIGEGVDAVYPPLPAQ